MDFTVIARAGLTQQEFSVLAGVSRVSTNMWVQGKMRPHRLHQAKIKALLSCLESAVAHGTFPLAETANKANRTAELRAIVKAEAVRPKTC